MDKDYLIKSEKHGGKQFYDGAKSINGYCKNALEFLKVLRTLPLRNIDELRNLLKKDLSWCPKCVFNWRYEGRPNYYPLS